MTVTNRAIGEQINLAEVLNTKLEAPIRQSEMGLDVAASATGQAVRWNEFSLKHNNDGSFKSGIIKGADIANATITADNIANATITATQIADEAITGTKIANATITADNIANATITADNIANNTITATQIADEAITNNQISATAAIQASKLAIQKLYNKSSVANPSNTADTDGTVVDLLPPTGFLSLVPLGMNIVFEGTFGTETETVTANVTVTYSDSTIASITKTATAAGTVTLNTTDFLSLIKDGVYINKISVKSQSTIDNSAVTVTFNHYGFYL